MKLKILLLLLLIVVVISGCTDKVEVIPEPCISLEKYEAVEYDFFPILIIVGNVTLDFSEIEGFDVFNISSFVSNYFNNEISMRVIDSSSLRLVTENSREDFYNCKPSTIVELTQHNLTHLIEDICIESPIDFEVKIKSRTDKIVKVCR